MLNKLLWVFGPLALIYLVIHSVNSDVEEISLTDEFIEATHDVCMPALSLGLAVNNSRFQKKISDIIPSSFGVKDGKVIAGKNHICAQYRFKKPNSPVSVSFCQNANKELSCSIGAQAKPMSLKEHKFIKSVNEFAPWPSIYPNKIRKKNGQPEILTSRILCRPNTVSKNLNSVTIAQRRGFHVVWVRLSQTACEKLAI